jgi:hypothetical protein
MDIQLRVPVQSVPITTNIVSANPVHGVVYLIQHCGNLLVTGGFLRVLWFPSPIKLIDTYINEILLKVTLNTILARIKFVF